MTLFSGMEGQVVIVSGASRGVGRCYALALAEAGAQVVATGRTLEGDPERPGNLTELVATARKKGWKVAAYTCDLIDEDSLRRVVRQTVANYGGLDVLVNNAVGHSGGQDPLAIAPDVWARSMEANVRAPYALMAESVPHMIARGGGSIVNITSGSAGVTVKGAGAHKGLLAYGVSKAALERINSYFAAEYADANIAVNAVSPGHVSHYESGGGGREPHREYWGAPLLFLAKQRPAQGGITGQVLHTYGYGDRWGPKFASPPEWDEGIRAMLSQGGSATRPIQR